MNYLKKTINGLTWTTFLRASVRGVTFIRVAILARVIGLSPEAFGIFGIVTIVLGLMEIVTETGINVFLLQEDGKWEKYINTAWILSIIRGFLISLLMILGSSYIANFFSAPSVATLIRLASIIPLIRGFINPSCVRLLKELKFTSEFSYRTAILVVETAATLIITFITKSAMGLVIGLICSAAFETLLSFIVIRPLPKLTINRQFAAEIIKRGKWVTGFGLFDYVVTNFDNIIVGKVLGTSTLGLYQNAYKLSTLPLTEVNDIVYKTSFPIFSHMGVNNFKDLKKAAIKTAIGTIAAMIPLSVLLFLFSNQIVWLVLGPAWTQAAGLVKILAFLGLIRGLSSCFNFLFMAQKKQKYVTIITCVQMVGLVGLIIPFVNKFGVNGAAIAALVASILALPFAVYFITKTLKDHAV